MGIFKLRNSQTKNNLSKTKAKNSRKKKLHLEIMIKQNDKTEYGVYKQELDIIYNEISTRIKTTSRCNQNAFGEKSNNLFFKLRKTLCLTKYI